MRRKISLLFRPGSRTLSTPATYFQWPLSQAKTEFSKNLKEIEKNWKEFIDPFSANTSSATADVKYILAMFPYPSGRLHMGHLRVYSISDALSRYYCLNGYKVIHPIGWDAFGLPAENAAIERGLDPKEWTYSNIDEMCTQLNQTGVCFDWNRELFTCDPNYYRWTQWIFLQLYKHGLVRHTLSEVWWDPVDKTTLATEQVDPNSGRAWRSGAIAQKRKLLQWAIETPRFAKRLLDGLDKLMFNWGEVAAIQANRIGKCDVYRFMLPVEFKPESNCGSSESHNEILDLRLKNPEDLSLAEFIVINSNHSFSDACSLDHFEQYALTGYTVFNFITNKQMPVIVDSQADGDRTGRYVLDCRLGLPTKDESDALLQAGFKFVSSEQPMPSRDKQTVLTKAEAEGYGGYLTSKTFSDWVVSRQRRWGTPIPLILDNEHQRAIPVNEKDLPVFNHNRGQKLKIVEFPTGVGYYESDTLDTFFDSSWYYLRFLDPYNSKDLVDRELSHGHMPVDVYVGGVEHADLHLLYARFISYFLYDLGILKDPEPFKRLLPHGVVKSRTFRIIHSGQYLHKDEVQEIEPKKFIHKTTNEPVESFDSKMSKSKNNGIDPIKEIEMYGVDLTRLQILGAAAPRAHFVWGTSQKTELKGYNRLLNLAASLVSTYIEQRSSSGDLLPPDHKIEVFCKNNYNSRIREISIFLELANNHCAALDKLYGLFNAMTKVDSALIGRSEQFERCLHSAIIMLQVFAPHCAAELWGGLSGANKIRPELFRSDDIVFSQDWPKIDSDAIVEFVICIFYEIVRSEIRRDLVEPLELDDLVVIATKQTHSRVFELLKRDGLQIKKISVEKRIGLRVTLNIEMADDVTKDAVISVFHQVSSEKQKNKKK